MYLFLSRLDIITTQTRELSKLSNTGQVFDKRNGKIKKTVKKKFAE